MVPRKNDDCIECKNVLNWKTAGHPVSSSSSCTFHVDGYRMGSPIHWNTELNILWRLSQQLWNFPENS
jgi:hypothetical protein